ncbi:beta-N-acetylglucosaminidase domain-containing protein [Microbacterium sp. 179-I 3D3 NHS]|uniref:beta-N-acetylglucosaminidase domain-containing protein n=1 Tax=Microbacterium sp. 179-I 3D3 NHS TaxID=3142382 RepID=UPI0039A3113B
MRADDTENALARLLPLPRRAVFGHDRHPLAALPVVEQVAADLPDEAYRLRIDADGVVIAASGRRGLRYGRTTLAQLTDAAGEVPEVRIDDAPTLRRRGIIEGFYGEPWSHEERLAALRLAGRLKMNSYVYAPKDDPYHRERWREPYPEAELARLVDLVREGERHGVDVVIALHPAGSMVFSDEAEHERLAAKASGLWEAGIPDVALLFDDVPPTPANDADRAAFGDHGAGLGAAHALAITRFRDAVGSRLAGELLVVPMDYAGVQANDYRTAFAAGLPDGVLVWWTGRDIVVGEITRDDIDAAAAVFGDRLVLWDNFPVNDFDRGRAFLGPLIGRTSEVAGSALHGAWTNPMVEFAPGGFGIAAFADWAWNPEQYAPARSAAAALPLIAGEQARILAPLVETLSSWPPSAPMDPALAAAADAALGGSATAREALRSRLAALALTVDDDAAEPARSLGPWLSAAADMADAGLLALDLLDLLDPLDPLDGGEVHGEIARVEESLARAEGHAAKVATDVVPPFVRAVLARAVPPDAGAAPAAEG